MNDALLKEVDRWDAMASLTHVSLIKSASFTNGTPATSVHRLVQVVMRERLASTDQITKFLELAISALVQAYPRDEFGRSIDRPRHQQVLPHALFVQKQWSHVKVSDALARGLRSLVGLLQHVAENVDIEAQHHNAIELSKTTFGEASTDLANRYYDFASFLRDHGQHGEAEQAFRQSLEISRRFPDLTKTVFSSRLVANAELLIAMGQQGEGEKLAKEALALYTKQRGLDADESRAKVASINTMGNALLEKGDYRKAEKMFREAIKAGESDLGPKDNYVATCKNNLAFTFFKLMKFSEAVELFAEILSLKEHGLGRQSLSFAITLSNLADCELENDQTSLSEKHHLEAISIAAGDQRNGQQHEARFRCKYSKMLLSSGRLQEARSEAERALISQDNLLGRGHKWTRDSATCLAKAYYALGEKDNAEELITRYGLSQDFQKKSRAAKLLRWASVPPAFRH